MLKLNKTLIALYHSKEVVLKSAGKRRDAAPRLFPKILLCLLFVLSSYRGDVFQNQRVLASQTWKKILKKDDLYEINTKS